MISNQTTTPNLNKQYEQQPCRAIPHTHYWLATAALVFINAPLAYADTTQQSAPCIECHQQAHLQPLTRIVDDAHTRAGVSCLDCHNSTAEDQGTEHHNHSIIAFPGSASCQACHKK